MSLQAPLWDVIKEALSKTNLANLASFLLVVTMMGYGVMTENTDVVLTVGGAGIGYLFGANKNT